MGLTAAVQRNRWRPRASWIFQRSNWIEQRNMLWSVSARYNRAWNRGGEQRKGSAKVSLWLPDGTF